MMSLLLDTPRKHGTHRKQKKWGKKVIPFVVFVMLAALYILVPVFFFHLPQPGLQFEESFMGSPPKAAFPVGNLCNSTASVAPARAEVTLFNGTKGCMLNLSDDVTFLGSGDRGHAFTTYMKCPNGYKELIAFKVAKNWDLCPPHYISSENIDKKRLTFQFSLEP